jgi:hypothetical protein
VQPKTIVRGLALFIALSSMPALLLAEQSAAPAAAPASQFHDGDRTVAAAAPPS